MTQQELGSVGGGLETLTWIHRKMAKRAASELPKLTLLRQILDRAFKHQLTTSPKEGSSRGFHAAWISHNAVESSGLPLFLKGFNTILWWSLWFCTIGRAVGILGDLLLLLQILGSGNCRSHRSSGGVGQAVAEADPMKSRVSICGNNILGIII